MKKLLCVLLSLILAVAACSCGAKSGTATSEDQTVHTDANSSLPPENNAGDDDAQDDDTAAIGDIEVDPGLFSVTLTVPADFVDAGMTQEELDESAAENGYKSATLNEDGSVTYVMTKAQHREMVDSIAEFINESLEEMTGSEDYPNFVSIEADDDYTQYTIVTKSGEVDYMESFSVLALYLFSDMYHAFSGTEAGDVSVQFINEATGEVIEEANSGDME